MRKNDIIQEDAWAQLRAFTNARIALGRTGTAIPLKENLAFRLAHAHARDAVYTPLNVNALSNELQFFQLPVIALNSQAANRQEYLQRPDLGRKLSPESVTTLQQAQIPATDIAIIIADGLSAIAVQSHLFLLLQALVPLLQSSGYTLSPFTIIQQGRVAIGDETAFLLNARLALLLIGERPGLSAADSLGAYMTFAPQTGLTDEARNCISNIRPEGLPLWEAAQKIHHLVQQSLRLQLSGVQLKDTYTPALSGNP